MGNPLRRFWKPLSLYLACLWLSAGMTHVERWTMAPGFQKPSGFETGSGDKNPRLETSGFDDTKLTDLDADGRPDMFHCRWNGHRTVIISNNGRFPFETLAKDTTWTQALDQAFNINSVPLVVYNAIRDTWGDYEIVIDVDEDGVYDGEQDFYYHALDINNDGKAEGDVSLGLIGPRDGVIKTTLHLDGTRPTTYQDFKNGRYAANEQLFRGHSEYLMNVQGTGFFLNGRYRDPLPLLRAWEVPIAWFDFSGSGHNDMVVRCADTSEGRLRGKYGEFEVAFELNGNNTHERFHTLDMQLTYTAYKKGGYPYARHEHDIKSLRGRADADFIFKKRPELHAETRRQFAPVLDLYKLGTEFEGWESVFLLFDEDDDDIRWEEMFSPAEPEWQPLSDHLGDRYEIDHDFSGRGQLYVSRFDGRLHLYGAEEGLWTVDCYGLYHYNNLPDTYEGRIPPAGMSYQLLRYFDDNKNGFVDRIVFSKAQYGRENQTEVNESEVSLLDFADADCPEPDVCPLLSPRVDSRLTGWSPANWDGNPVDLSQSPAKAGSDKLRRIYSDLSGSLWRDARMLYATAKKLGIALSECESECSPGVLGLYSHKALAKVTDYRPLSGYALLTDAHSLREQYDKGYWLKEKAFADILRALPEQSRTRARGLYYTGRMSRLCEYVQGQFKPKDTKQEGMNMFTESSPNKNNYRKSVDLALGYLRKFRAGDGSYRSFENDLVAHYKTPFVFQQLGYREEALRTLNYIFSKFLDEEGDLRRPGRKTDNETYAAHLDHYMNSWIVRGAAALKKSGEAARMLSYLKSQQNPETGGVRTRRGHPLTDVGTTAAFGLAALDGGDLDAARRAGDFLMKALDNQPEPGNFYLCYKDNEPITDIAAGEAGFYVIRSNVIGQSYWYSGIAIAFLTRLAYESSDHAFVEGARRYVEVIARLAGDKYKTLASGKVGWGMETLYRRTGDRRLLDAAKEVAGNLVGLQLRDGQWAFSGNPDELVSAATIDATVELALWVHILDELSENP